MRGSCTFWQVLFEGFPGGLFDIWPFLFFVVDDFFTAMESTGPLIFTIKTVKINNQSIEIVNVKKTQGFNYSTNDIFEELTNREPAQFSLDYDVDPIYLQFKNAVSSPASFKSFSLQGGWLVFEIKTNLIKDQLGIIREGELSYQRHFYFNIKKPYIPGPNQVIVPFSQFCYYGTGGATIKHQYNNGLQLFSDFNASWSYHSIKFAQDNQA